MKNKFLSLLLTSGLCLSAVAETTGSETLDRMRDLAIREHMCVYAICEIKDGVSRTVTITPASLCQNTYSVAKSFIATAIGMLEDRNLLNTDDLIWQIFPKDFPASADPKWKTITIKNVLQHRGGFRPGELDIDAQNYNEWHNLDFLNILFTRPVQGTPGKDYAYSDGAFYLLGRVVAAKSGIRADDFLIRELLIPLKFREYAFSKCPQGHPMGATGMYISTEDMAKLGQLYIQEGVWNGKQILSKRYVKKALENEFGFDQAYGGYAKGGYLGQILYFNPKTKQVIAIHSTNGDVDKLLQAGIIPAK